MCIRDSTISVQTSLANLVTEINQEAAGVTATLNSDNTITLSNTTGNDIVIGGNAPTDAGFTAGTYLGYLKLANVDGTFVKIEAMTKANGYASNSGNIDDLEEMMFDLKSANKQIKSLKTYKENRNNLAVTEKLNNLKVIAKSNNNIMPAILDCVRNQCTLGEISNTLRDIFGTHG